MVLIQAFRMMFSPPIYLCKYSYMRVYSNRSYGDLLDGFESSYIKHQFRYPIFGDEKYGGGLSKTKGFINEYSIAYHKLMLNFGRHGLHAKKLEFLHPKTKLIINFESIIPDEFIKLNRGLDTLVGY